MLTTDNTPTNETAEPADRFYITDRSGIDWYLSKLAAKQAERDLIASQAAQMVAALDTDIQRLKSLYEAEAVETARQELATDKWRRKSLPTFHGSIGFRDVPGGIRLASGPDSNAAATLAKAQEIGATVTTIDSATYVEAARTALETTGEVFPGIEQYPARESVSIKFGSDTKPSRKPTPKGNTPIE